MPDKKTIAVEVDDITYRYLRALAHSSSIGTGVVEDVVKHLVYSAADGVRRPGAWEHDWCAQAFGSFPKGTAPPDKPWSMDPPTDEEIAAQKEEW